MPAQRILLVDGEPELLKEMQIRLVSWGHDVLTANSGEEAIELAQKELPDAIILDIMMPEDNGLAVAHSLAQFTDTKDIPVIFVSGAIPENIIGKAKAARISGRPFIPKPIDMEKLIEQIKLELKQ